MNTPILIAYAAMSLIAFFAYGIDKRRAKRGRWRISEAVLLGLGIFGGAAGALLGMRLFRHKTKHIYFWIILFAALAVQLWLLFLDLSALRIA